MNTITKTSANAPFRDMITDQKGYLTRVWYSFFQFIADLLEYVGQEQSFPIADNQGSAANITPLKFDYQFTSCAFIEYLIQRVASSTVIQAGILRVTYNPTSNSWSIAEYGTAGPDSSGVTFSITALGQVQYTSTNLAGTQTVGRIVFRVRPISAKLASYSKVG